MSDSELDLPLSELTKRSTQPIERKQSSPPPTQEVPSPDDDDDTPLSQLTKFATRKLPKRSTRSTRKTRSASKPEPQPKPEKKRTRKAKSTAPTKQSRVEDDEQPEPLLTKWTTLSHNGVLFAPLYEPHGVPLLYDGEEMILPPEAEEWATHYASVVGTPWVSKEVFNNNFWKCWKPFIKGLGIKSLSKCDFTLIKQHLDVERERRKNRTKEEKEEEKKKKLKEKETYGYAIVDGRKELIGNFRVEPPSLFRGRGAHPKMGMFKSRIEPKDVTINIQKDIPIPKPGPPYEGHAYGNVIHDTAKEYLAYWTEPNFNITKYVRLSATSQWKGESDLNKFEVARRLAIKIDDFRSKYWGLIQSDDRRDQQVGVVLYLIDHFAFRVGHQKGSDEADTVGCCSLRKDHVMLTRRKRWWRERQPINQSFDESQIEDVYQSDNEDVLEDPMIKASMGNLAAVNVPLLPPSGTCPTYDFSEDEDDVTATSSTVGGDALMGYSGYERDEEGVSDDEGLDGVWPFYIVFDFLGKDSVRFFQRKRIHCLVWKRLFDWKSDVSRGADLFDCITPTMVNSKLKELTEIDDISGKSIRTFNASATLARMLPLHEVNLEAKDKVTQLVAFFNECNKKVAILCNHQRAVSKTFDQQVANIEKKIELQKKKLRYYKSEKKAVEKGLEIPVMPIEIRPKTRVKKETKQEDDVKNDVKKVKKPRKRSIKQIEKSISTTELSISRLNSQLNMKESLKAVSLTTSKTNYIDPRIVVSFAKKYDIPLSKFYTKSLQERFTWADVDADWEYLENE
ncbi:hypothetical protein P9112_009380 [Eukaryota sp. TZLM1-RC]